MPPAIVQADTLASARSIFADKDAAKFAQLAGELGIACTFETFSAYVYKHAKTRWSDDTEGCGAAGLKLIYEALTTEHGFAMDVVNGHTTLAARDGKRVVFAMQEGSPSQPFKNGGWMITPRWYKDPTRNRPTIDNWLADPTRATDAIAIPITRSIAATTAPTGGKGEALLAAVCADPEDLAARLVYGDWLVEQGDMRGEFIRVQCDLESNRTDELAKRARDLHVAYADAIKAPLERFVDFAEIRRGLVERVVVFSDLWIKHGAKIVAAHPINALDLLIKDAKDFAKISAMPAMANIRSLKVEGRAKKGVTNSRATIEPSAVAKSAMFRNLRYLSFQYIAETGAEWAKFFATLEAPNLEDLYVREPLDDDALVALARNTGLPKLGEFNLWSTDAKSPDLSDGLKALAKKSSLTTLTIGGLKQDAIIAKNVKAILGSPTITKLVLDWTGAKALTTAAIAASGKHLEELSFYRCEGLDVGAIAEMLESNYLANLRRLYVYDSAATTASAEAFTAAVCNAPDALKELVWDAGDRHRAGTATREQAERILASGRIYDWEPPTKGFR